MRTCSTLFFFLLIDGILLQAQAELENQFQNYAIQNLQEKMYVHLNRTDHIVGEILWFKIYNVDGILHRPLDLSKVAYVEVLDGKNKPVLQAKVELKNGEGAGSLYIPATLGTGNYLLRAYTNWMKNSPVQYFFSQRIRILNTLKSRTADEASIPTRNETEIQFFPEGGYLVEGIESRVGFKITDENGNAINDSGAVLNQTNDTIVKFKSSHYGMGSFVIRPNHSNQYKAVLSSERKLKKHPLPEIRNSGFSLRVIDTIADSLNVLVSNTDKSFTAHLFIHTRQSIKVSEVKSSNIGVLKFRVAKNMLADGVSHITILDELGHPVCERLYFKKPNSLLNISPTTNQMEYSVRRNVQLQIQASQDQDASLSISVYRGDSLKSNESISTYLYLTSDLSGQIENPSYYFTDTAEASEAADILMLTHGWRRFKWDDILTLKQSVLQYIPETTGPIVQAKILNENQIVAPNKLSYLTIPNKRIRLYMAISDSSGNLYFQVKPFEGQQKIVVQPNLSFDSTYRVQIQNPFSIEYENWRNEDVRVDKSSGGELLNRSMSMQVQDAFYEDEVYFRFKISTNDTLPFYGAADETYLLDDYTRFPVLEEVLREYVKGVWVRKRGDRYRLMVLDKARIEKTEVFRDNPLILFDGVPVFDVNRLLEIDPLKIKKLEVMTRRYFLGPLAFRGIVSFSTYNGDLSGFELDPRSVSLDYEGLQSQREFFNPRYISPELRGSRLPDQRYQLYWNAKLKLVKGKALVDFYTSDVEGNFFVVVEGLSSNGMPGSGITSFKVSR